MICAAGEGGGARGFWLGMHACWSR
jgi:hypothetical protein